MHGVGRTLRYKVPRLRSFFFFSGAGCVAGLLFCSIDSKSVVLFCALRAVIPHAHPRLTPRREDSCSLRDSSTRGRLAKIYTPCPSQRPKSRSSGPRGPSARGGFPPARAQLTVVSLQSRTHISFVYRPYHTLGGFLRLLFRHDPRRHGAESREASSCGQERAHVLDLRKSKREQCFLEQETSSLALYFSSFWFRWSILSSGFHIAHPTPHLLRPCPPPPYPRAPKMPYLIPTLLPNPNPNPNPKPKS